jgi:tetratricopeptide (TPR) repeat protein
MAKLRRSDRRPTTVKKARAKAPAAATKKARTARPVVAKKPIGKKVATKPLTRPAAKPAARPAARPAPKLKAPAAARAVQKPKAPPKAQTAQKRPGKDAVKASVQQPRRSTYADAVVLYERGLQALQAKRYRDAAETLKRVIAEFPEEKELHERAELYIRVCARQLTPPDATPKTPEEQVYAATLAVNAGAFDRAIALLTAALQQKKDNDSAEYMFGVVLAMKGDQPGALAHFARAVELNPDSRELLRKEPELEALRQTDELKALLAASLSASRKERRPQPRARR